MLGNFIFHNPTKLYFGEDALDYLDQELPNYGKNVQLIYGGGSIKKNGIYDLVVEKLRKSGKNVIEDPGVMPNPTLEKLYEGIRIARENKVDFLLAVGGGSCVDYAKILAASVMCQDDPWEKYYIRQETQDCELIPIGVVLTMAGTGSEMDGGAVLTNSEKKLKYEHVFGPENYPRFAILNPRFTMTVPRKQMVAGIYDIFSHVCEQYFSDEDDSTTDYLSEGLMRSVIHSSLVAVEDPEDYEARSNIMWSATIALCKLFSRGKRTDWMVHQIGHSIGAQTDATHGMTLSAISLPYYRKVLPYGLSKFVRFAENVWDVDPEGRTEQEIADEGLRAMESWMRKLGVSMNLKELGVTEDMFDDILDGTVMLDSGFVKLSREDIRQILKESL